jgi:hypothetical protein
MSRRPANAIFSDFEPDLWRVLWELRMACERLNRWFEHRPRLIIVFIVLLAITMLLDGLQYWRMSGHP